MKPQSLFCMGLLVLAVWLNACRQQGAVSEPDSFFTVDSHSAFPAGSFVSGSPGPGYFPLFQKMSVPPILLDSQDFSGVQKVAELFREDLYRVTNHRPERSYALPGSKTVILIGTLGKSRWIDQLIENGKLDVSGLKGKWETFIIQPVAQPFPEIDQALVIAGSDKRGTIYGMFELSRQMGVSPWYWWADVPVQQREALYIKPGRHTLGEPKVKYRGIFINDEAPALSGWAHEKFGGFNHRFYGKVFELILRMKGNYLWPAMWGRAIYDDDPLSPELADELGIVLGTSHHEPLMRAHVEWERYGSGPWNYEKNEKTLRQFWREGMERMGDNESIVTIGMRGDGDEPMTEGTAIALLERIVKDQREIISDVTGKPASETPQLWALYKEVQEYYDKGMRVPEDVTLLLCDDNWGNIRKLPKPGDTLRAGGYGIYYHYDYVGGPRNYKWINTNQIARVWEQMHLAYEYGARQIWIVNVGDIKPMEYPTTFFLDYAWGPEKWPAERIPEYTRRWAAGQFGAQHAGEIAEILRRYTRYNSRRKPELLAPDTYSLVNFREFERIVADYKDLVLKAESIGKALPEAYKSAYFQLVLFPIKAGANLNELYYTVALNRLYARQGRSTTNQMADRAVELFQKDQVLTAEYHRLNGGKWNHMMSQTHIGYTYWQQPDRNAMPEVEQIEVPPQASMGVAVESSAAAWPGTDQEAALPEFDAYNRQTYYIELFNRGTQPFDYAVSVSQPWIVVEQQKGEIKDQTRIPVSIDWQEVPEGIHHEKLVVSGAGSEVEVQVPVRKPAGSVSGFVENNGVVAMEAAHYTRAVPSDEVSWEIIPQLGRTQAAVTPVPVMAGSQSPGGASPCLEYKLHLFDPGQEVRVKAFFSPTLNFHETEGLRYAVSFDDQEPQVVNIHAGRTFQDWEESVRNNITVATSMHRLTGPGQHTLKFWMVDPGLALQRLVVETGQAPESYLGPPESLKR